MLRSNNKAIARQRLVLQIAVDVVKGFIDSVPERVRRIKVPRRGVNLEASGQLLRRHNDVYCQQA